MLLKVQGKDDLNDLILMSKIRYNRLLYKPVLVWFLCIGFLQHGKYNVLYLFAREQMHLDGLIFYNSVAFCRTESKIHSILGSFRRLHH